MTVKKKVQLLPLLKLKLGYTFEVYKGYQFKQEIIFAEYVNKLYNLRMEYKNHPLNLICKLLMNSLYGKFGMSPEVNIVDIHDVNTPELKTKFLDMIKEVGESVEQFIHLENEGKMVIVRDSLIKLKEVNDDNTETYFAGLDINIAIASAVTSLARNHINQFKNNIGYNVYYSETDSIVIDKMLPDYIVGNELGQMKLEYVIEQAVFIAPKVYGFITDDNKQILKVKGLSHEAINELQISDLELLLIKGGHKEVNHKKWYKTD